MSEDFVMKRVCYPNNAESKCIDLDTSEWLNSTALEPKLRTYENRRLCKLLFGQKKTFYYFSIKNRYCTTSHRFRIL